MKLLVDMNLSPAWVDLLVGSGHEAVHWSLVGRPNAADEELLSWARTDSAVILTNDLDFGIALISGGLVSPSVIQLRSDDLRPSTLGAMVLETLRLQASSLSRGALITIDPVRARIRLLDLLG